MGTRRLLDLKQDASRGLPVVQGRSSEAIVLCRAELPLLLLLSCRKYCIAGGAFSSKGAKAVG